MSEPIASVAFDLHAAVETLRDDAVYAAARVEVVRHALGKSPVDVLGLVEEAEKAANVVRDGARALDEAVRSGALLRKEGEAG